MTYSADKNDESQKRKAKQADWQRTSRLDPKRVALIRPKLAADAASREPAPITLPRLKFMEKDI